MATAVQKITLSSSRDIPFNKLVLSGSNVRRVKAGVSIEELAEDIARRTLLQSLNVRPILDAEGVETGMFEVPAGGRRYRALQLLVKQKRLAKTEPVPCVVRDPSVDISAEEDSLAENVHRTSLLLTITERRRNRPVTLDAALNRLSDPRTRLLINERSGRAAVRVPAPSLMFDDGEIERRVRLIRAMEHHSLPRKAMAESHWTEADRERFAAAWHTEVAEVPEFTDSTIHVVAGLLLPIWKRLQNELTRVYRLQSDAGERIIGRKVSTAWVATALAGDTPTLTPENAFAALLEARTVFDLAEGLQLRRVRVMGAGRIELSGFNDTMRDRLKAYGLFPEIISWKLRMFVPTDASGVAILARVLDIYPVERIGEREAA